MHFLAPGLKPGRVRAGGDAGRIPSPTAACAKEKAQTRVVTAKAGNSPGVPACLAFRPFTPSKTSRWWSSAYFVRPPVD